MTRHMREMSADERAEWQRQVAQVQSEYPVLAERFRAAEAAAAEDSFSGILRREILSTHARGITLPVLLNQAGVEWPILDAFLHGEGLLSNDVIDRQVRFLGLCVAAEQTSGINHP